MKRSMQTSLDTFFPKVRRPVQTDNGSETSCSSINYNTKPSSGSEGPLNVEQKRCDLASEEIVINSHENDDTNDNYSAADLKIDQTPSFEISSSNDCLSEDGTDPTTPMCISVSPDIVRSVQQLAPKSNKKKTSRSFINKGGEGQTQNTTITNKQKNQFLISTINDYLEVSNALKHLLTEKSHSLLYIFGSMTKPSQDVLSTLYWSKSSNQKWGRSKDNKIEKELRDSGFLEEFKGELPSEIHDCLDLLDTSILQYICKHFKLYKRNMKREDCITELQKYSSRRVLFSSQQDNSQHLLQYLRREIDKCYKLSDSGCNTFDEVIILMEFVIKPSSFANLYPIPKNTKVDNVNLLFKNREEFYRYKEALNKKEDIKQKEGREKCAAILETYRFVESVLEEEISR